MILATINMNSSTKLNNKHVLISRRSATIKSSFEYLVNAELGQEHFSNAPLCSSTADKSKGNKVPKIKSR